MYDEKELQQFDKWGVDRPTIEQLDVSPDNIREKLQPLVATANWHMEGNELVTMTAMGELRQRIDPDYICTGTDPEGLPILKKVVS